MKKTLLTLSLALLVVSSTGCTVHSGNEKVANMSQSDMKAQIKKNKTTQAQIREMLGKPTATALDANGQESWTYTYTEAGADGASYIPIVGVLFGGTDVQSHSLVIAFNENGTVKNFSTSSSKDKYSHI